MSNCFLIRRSTNVDDLLRFETQEIICYLPMVHLLIKSDRIPPHIKESIGPRAQSFIGFLTKIQEIVEPLIMYKRGFFVQFKDTTPDSLEEKIKIALCVSCGYSQVYVLGKR